MTTATLTDGPREVLPPVEDAEPAVNVPVAGRVTTLAAFGRDSPDATYEVVVSVPAAAARAAGIAFRLGPVTLTPARSAPAIAFWPNTHVVDTGEPDYGDGLEDGYSNGFEDGRKDAKATGRRLELLEAAITDLHLVLHPGPYRFCSDPVCAALHRDLP